jgi:hypothetical protein
VVRFLERYGVVHHGLRRHTLIHQIVTNPPVVSLPDIDASLMVLMGISQGGYLAKKVVAGTG